MSTIKVLLVDDHTLLREGIRALLTLHKDIKIVGEASEGKEAVIKTVDLKPDVVILDIVMPGMDGLEAARQIRKKSPETKILILTQYDNKEYVLSAIKAGVSGFIPKRDTASELIAAILAVYQGNPFLYPTATSALIKDYLRQAGKDPYESLTERRKEILRLIAEGYSSKTIAQKLNLSSKTIESHRAKLMEQLDLHNQVELTKYALHKGLVQIHEK